MIVASGLDAIRGLSAWTESHVNHCAPCRQQAETHQDIARKLTLCATEARRSPSPFLQSRIMAAWDREVHEPVRVKQSFLPLWNMGVIGGCVALLALLVALHPAFQPEQEAPDLTQSETPGLITLPADTLVETVTTVNTRVMDGLSKTLENPLEREMESMLQGARSAAQLFAQNFLPGSDTTIRLIREN